MNTVFMYLNLGRITVWISSTNIDSIDCNWQPFLPLNLCRHHIIMLHSCQRLLLLHFFKLAIITLCWDENQGYLIYSIIHKEKTSHPKQTLGFLYLPLNLSLTLAGNRYIFAIRKQQCQSTAQRIQLVPLQLLLYCCFKSWLIHCLYHCFDAVNDQDLAVTDKEYTPWKNSVILELCKFSPFQGDVQAD